MALSVLITALVTSPAIASGNGRVALAPSALGTTADLAATLGADGTFRGAPGVEGTIDASGWTLVSDPTAGEAPRFTRSGTRAVAPTAAGDWSALGSNGTGNGAFTSGVVALAASGTDLYAAGGFASAAIGPVGKWSGTTWSALGSIATGFSGWISALAVSGADLYIGGNFTNAAGVPEADYVAKWNGSTWSALGSNGAGNGALGGRVNALAVSGTVLFAGGNFANNIARWNGTAWSSLGGAGAINDEVSALAVAGSDLYVGGYFDDAGGVPEADWVARWDGTSWFALGSNGSGNGVLNAPVYALAASGSDVYVGGAFGNIGGMPTADNIAKWSIAGGWSALGSNGSGDGALYLYVFALAVSGTDVYVGGEFTDGAGIPAADHVAKWNGASWSALGANGGTLDDDVNALAASGDTLFVGGGFDDVSGIATADKVAGFGIGTAVDRKPDGRIRLGTGPFVGNNVYNTTGVGQGRTGSAARGASITFGISIGNDGTVADSFKVKATGTATTTYNVKYFRGSTDITAAVVAGTYQTPSVAPATSYLITAKVTVKSTAGVGSNVTRLVTVKSGVDGTRRDAGTLVGKRA